MRLWVFCAYAIQQIRNSSEYGNFASKFAERDEPLSLKCVLTIHKGKNVSNTWLMTSNLYLLIRITRYSNQSVIEKIQMILKTKSSRIIYLNVFFYYVLLMTWNMNHLTIFDYYSFNTKREIFQFDCKL